MPEDYSNIYKIARRAAGYTQESAAEQLDISVDSVRAYETYQRTPPNEIVERMVVCFHAPQLAYQHLHETSGLVSRIIPQLEQRSILEVAIRIYNRMRSFTQGSCLDRLMAIAEDGRVDETERPEFEAIVEELRSIIQSGLELEIFCASDPPEKKRTPRGGTLKAFSSGTCVRERLQDYCNTISSKCKPQFNREGGALSVITWGFVLIGICTLTSGLFRLVDRIEGRW